MIPANLDHPQPRDQLPCTVRANMRTDALCRAGGNTRVFVVLDLCQKVATGILARLPGIACVGLGSSGVVRAESKKKRPPVGRALCEHLEVVTFL
jgi:hypothetical protein